MIFIALQKMKLLRTQDLTRLYFGSSSRTNKRLRKLCREGYIKCKTQLPSSDYLYSLGPKGEEYLVEHYDDYNVHTKEGRTFNVNHLIALNSIRISLALAADKQSDWKLIFFRPEWELKCERDPTLLTLIPDAIFQLQLSDNGESKKRTFVLEVDLGSEAPSYLVKTKLKKYFEIKNMQVPFYGFTDFKLLIITTSSHRILRFAEAVSNEPLSHDVLFAVLEHLNEDTVSGRIFLSAHAIGLQSQPAGNSEASTIYQGLME
jgi:hypothetical protein